VNLSHGMVRIVSRTVRRRNQTQPSRPERMALSHRWDARMTTTGNQSHRCIFCERKTIHLMTFSDGLSPTGNPIDLSK